MYINPTNLENFCIIERLVACPKVVYYYFYCKQQAGLPEGRKRSIYGKFHQREVRI